MNSMGRFFCVTTWGESHGPAIGVIIDGCPPGIRLDSGELSAYLRDRDRPEPLLATSRIEENEAEILSGLWEDVTIGTPLSIVIRNKNIRSGDYRNLSGIFRPGHGDYTYYARYGTMPLPGGGRASGRECVARLAAGFVARKFLSREYPDLLIISEIINLAGVDISGPGDYERALARALALKEEGDSSGGIFRLEVRGLPPGIGSPVFGALDALSAGALMSIGGVKSVEVGKGRECAFMSGTAFNDNFTISSGRLAFASNNSGGVLSGISNGDLLSFTVSVKPVPSVEKAMTGSTPGGEIKKIHVRGRHDSNITHRVAVIAENMMAVLLADQLISTGTSRKAVL